MVSKMPRPEKMTLEDRERLARLENEVVEEESNGHVCATRSELLGTSTGFRYAHRKIFGIESPVRMRSLTGREFEEIKHRDDRFGLVVAVVDDDGNQLIAAEEIDAYLEKWDARTYIELLQFFNEHCLPSITIGALVEEQSKN